MKTFLKWTAFGFLGLLLLVTGAIFANTTSRELVKTAWVVYRTMSEVKGFKSKVNSLCASYPEHRRVACFHDYFKKQSHYQSVGITGRMLYFAAGAKLVSLSGKPSDSGQQSETRLDLIAMFQAEISRSIRENGGGFPNST